MAWNIPLLSWGQLSWLCPLPASCVHPQPPRCGAECETERALALCKHCSALAKTSLCSQDCLGHKCKT